MNIDTSQNYNGLFRQSLFLLVLLALGWILFDQLSFFLGSMLGAITLYVVFRSLQFRLVERYKWPKWLSALFITLISLVILGAAGWGMTKIIASEMPSIDAGKLVKQASGLVGQVNDFLGFQLIGPEVISRSEGMITKLVSSVLNTTYSFVVNIFMMLVVLYFMLAAGRKMEEKIFLYAPFSGRSLTLLKREVKNMIYSNAVGIPVIMVAQTITSSILYYFIGLESYLFWGFLTAVCGLVPLIGTGLVYVPMGIYFAVTGHLGTGIIVVAYGLLIISNVDNLIRIVLLGKYAHTHPLIVIFGVIIGIPMFGFWGIIFGPLFISGFLLLIKIYFVEYGLLSPDHPDVLCVSGARKRKSLKEMAAEKAQKRASQTKTTNQK